MWQLVTADRNGLWHYREIRMINIIVNGLLNRMAVRNYDNFPDDYLVVDVETTGVELGVDFIGQIGYCLVQKGKPVRRDSAILDWSRHPSVNSRWLDQRMIECRDKVEFDRSGRPTGKRYQLSLERMKKEGVEPLECLDSYLKVLLENRRSRRFVVAHNGYHFDGEFFSNAFQRYLGKLFRFGDYELFDTGMVEKASQANAGFWENETPRAWSLRIYNMALRGVRWALDRFCIPKYELDKKHGLDMTMAHDADYDAYLTHLLFEHFKSIATVKLT